jgi:hypothetical protein
VRTTVSRTVALGGEGGVEVGVDVDVAGASVIGSALLSSRTTL